MDVRNFLIDMDGVLVHGKTVIPGAQEFIGRLVTVGAKFLILTNNPLYTTRDLAHRLQSIGLKVSEEQIFTSANATAMFLQRQMPAGKAYVIGESGLTEAIHRAGYIITDTNPDYMVLGETNTYNYEQISKAVRLVRVGARFICTNPDVSATSEAGIIPACGAMAALIEKASGVKPFFIGKPNPLMMRTAMNHLGVHSENTVMIGDRLDTDIEAGVISGMETVLVLSGVTARADIERMPYRPTYIHESVATIDPLDLSTPLA